jgi:hypothetical protein
MARGDSGSAADAALGIAMRDTQETVALSDTSQKVAELYFRRLTEMTPSERLRIGAALWAAGDALQRAAARRNHPDDDQTAIGWQVAVNRFGLELAQRAYRRP